MKIKTLIFIQAFFVSALLAVSQTGYSYNLPADLSIKAVYFNHNSSSSISDGVTINSGYNSVITAPEWTVNDSSRFAYVKNADIGVKATLWRGDANITSAEIGISSYTGDSIGSFSSLTYTFSGADTLTQLMSTSSGTVPSSVGKHNLRLWYCVYRVNGNVTSPIQISSTSHIYYTLLDTPKAPFDGSAYNEDTPVIYNQAGPWVAVLDSACVWAKNCSTTVSAATCIADSLYWSKDTSSTRRELYYFYEEGEETPHFYSWLDDGASVDTFNLQSYITDSINNDENYVDCLDMANLMQIYCSSVGCSIDRWTIIKSSSGNFLTNYINPIGWTSWDDFVWTCHFVTEITNVFDACLRLNQSSPILPKNYDWVDYFDDFTENTVEEYNGNLVNSYPKIYN
jgi:hypothetical protein